MRVLLALSLVLILVSNQPIVLIPVPEPSSVVKTLNDFEGLWVDVTSYNAVPEQTDDDPEFSRCGATKERQIAVSRDLLSVYDCGDLIRIYYEQDGDLRSYEAYVWDTMNIRFELRADLLLGSYEEAIDHGIRKGVIVSLD